MDADRVRAALHDLVHRYAAYADDLALDDLAGLFAEDGVLVTPAGAHEGRAAVRAHVEALHGLDRTHHLVAGEVFDLPDGPDGPGGPGGPDNRAIGRVSGEAHHLTGDRDHVWYLVYRDRYVCRDGAWLFAHRAIDLRWTEDRADSGVEAQARPVQGP